MWLSPGHWHCVCGHLWKTPTNSQKSQRAAPWPSLAGLSYTFSLLRTQFSRTAQRCDLLRELLVNSFSGVPWVIAICNICNWFGQIRNGCFGVSVKLATGQGDTDEEQGDQEPAGLGPGPLGDPFWSLVHSRHLRLPMQAAGKFFPQ